VTAAIEIDVIIDESAWSAALPSVEDTCRRAALAVLAARAGDLTAGEACVVLSSDAAVWALNRRYRGRDTATNVLSFPAAPEGGWQLPGAEVPMPLGDVVVAFETAAREASVEGKALPDHLSHLVVHGMLHLLGYDHQTDEEAEVMEGLEIKVLGSLGIADPFANSTIDRDEPADDR
jgi:probable rRNA maturation factor